MSSSSNLFSNAVRSVQSVFAKELADTAAGDAQQYPRNAEDVYRTARYIRKASISSIPAELLKMILYHADYDCVHFRARATQSVTRRSEGSSEMSRLPYIETRPLRYLSPVGTADDIPAHGGRVRAVRLQVTGRDQGWGGDGRGSWSWFEVARRQSPLIGRTHTHFSNALKWAHNEVASKDWQQHEVDTESDERLQVWASGLRNGDRVSIIPMAQFPGWQCTASNGSIDIEVEVWR